MCESDRNSRGGNYKYRRPNPENSGNPVVPQEPSVLELETGFRVEAGLVARYWYQSSQAIRGYPAGRNVSRRSPAGTRPPAPLGRKSSEKDRLLSTNREIFRIYYRSAKPVFPASGVLDIAAT